MHRVGRSKGMEELCTSARKHMNQGKPSARRWGRSEEAYDRFADEKGCIVNRTAGTIIRKGDGSGTKSFFESPSSISPISGKHGALPEGVSSY